MFISGHKEILKDALEQVNLNLEPNVIDELYKGMIFPDLACTKLKVDKRKSSVLLTQQEYCWVFKLIKIIHGKYYGFSTIYQFQRGLLSILHSMGNSIDVPLKTTRDMILNMILGFLVATVKGDHGVPPKSAFWIGVILHMITDSYPRGHTIRHMFHAKPLEKVGERLKDGKTKITRKRINKVLVEMVKKEPGIKSLVYVKTHLINALEGTSVWNDVEYYLDTRMKSIYHSYLILHFIQHTKKNAKLIKARYHLGADTGIYESQTPKPYDLRYFQCYDYQEGIFHKKHDMFRDVKDKPIYQKRILPEVTMVLQLYHLFLENKINEQAFITTTYTYIATHTFRVRKDDLLNTPAFPHHGLSNKYKIKRLSEHLTNHG